MHRPCRGRAIEEEICRHQRQRTDQFGRTVLEAAALLTFATRP